MKQLLLIAYYFPPLGGAGVQRTLKFARYLRDFGWNPVILTINPPHGRLIDETLLADIPLDLKIFRTPAPALPAWLPWKFRHLFTRWLLLVDEQVGWLPFAIRQGKEILKSYDIDLIMSSSAPYTAHLIAYQLSHFARLPWIADFRDPWVGNITAAYPTRLHAAYAQRLERRVITTADQMLVVSDPMRNQLLNRYPDLPEGKVSTLTNGYDPADFVDIQVNGEPHTRFTITYTGSFYAGVTSPQNFFRALIICLDQQQIPAEKVDVFLVGNISPRIEEDVRRLGLSDIIHFTGYVPHRTSIAYLLKSDLLLLFIGDVEGSQIVYSGKIFEYLAAGKPVLALAPEGAAASLIREAQAGEIISPENIGELASYLALAYSKWEAGTLMVNSRSGIINAYDRRLLTQKLAAIMNELV